VLLCIAKGGEKMANEQNLIPQAHILTVEDASKGGKASGRKRRLQGAIERALESKASSAEFKELFESFGIEIEDEKTFASAIACAVVKKAAAGNLDAIALVRDTIGEKPKEEIALDGGVVIVDDIKA
jgi:hypothetical protein